MSEVETPKSGADEFRFPWLSWIGRSELAAVVLVAVSAPVVAGYTAPAREPFGGSDEEPAFAAAGPSQRSAQQGSAKAGASTAEPSFEVASVKPSSEPKPLPGGARSAGLPPVEQTNDHGAVHYLHVTMEGLVMRAYELMPADISAPGWMADTYYDVEAKAPAGTPYGQVPAMLRSLLAERFRMRVHWDSRQENGYSMTVGKVGLKVKKAMHADGTPITEADMEQGRGGPSSSFTSNADGTVRFKIRATMESFAKALRVDLQHAVVNNTGVNGMYDIEFMCSKSSLPGFPRFPQGGESGEVTPAPSVFTALRDIGLDLTPQKVTVKRLVVDSAEKVPTAN